MKRAGEQCVLSPKVKISDSPGDGDPINYVFEPPSLQSIALIAVAVKIYSYPDKEECLADYDSDSTISYVSGDYPSRIEETLKKLEEIFLPDSLKQQVSSIIEPIELQWSAWVEHASEEDYTKYCDLNELYKEKVSSYWTMEGTVDVVKLLKDIFDNVKHLNNEKVDFISLYESACIYCMEEYISEFWEKVPKKKRKIKCYARTGYYQHHLVAYWTASLNNELPKLMDELAENDRSDIYDMDLSICVNMISSFIISGNIIALKYFWSNKLTEQERSSNIQFWIGLVMETLKKEYFESYDDNFDLKYGDNSNERDTLFGLLREFYNSSDDDDFSYRDFNALTYIACFLLSHLNSQSEQKEILQNYAKVILLSLFSHWPLQRFLVPTITVMLDFISENIYVGIMLKIAHSIIRRRTEVLLREIWDISPPRLRIAFLHFLKYCAKAIAQLLFIGDDATIDRILNSATAEEKKLILFRMLKESELRMFLQSNKLAVSAIDSLASRILSTDCDLHSFKQDVMSRYARDLSSDWITSGDFESLDKLWNWASLSIEETREFKDDYIDLMYLYRSLIILGNYEHVHLFLNWYFETEEKELEFKKSLVHEDYFDDWRSFLWSLSDKGKDGWERFEKLITYSFGSLDEIRRVKKVFTEFVEQDESFTGYNNEFNSLFKNWCQS